MTSQAMKKQHTPDRSAAGSDWRFAEFFAGIGLMRLGLEHADVRWRFAFANDFDPRKRRMYIENFQCADHDINGADVRSLSGDLIPDIHLAAACFPCTDLSIAGERGGLRSGESSAFWDFIRVLTEMGSRRPPVVLLENVVGFLDSNGGEDFIEAMQSLNSLGYAVDPFMVNAQWFVPQSRLRLFVVCKNDRFTRNESAPPCAASRLRPAKLTTFIEEHADVIDWSIRTLPDPPAKSNDVLRDLIQDPELGHDDWWAEERVRYLCDQMLPHHSRWIAEYEHSRSFHYATAFRRMRTHADGVKRSTAELRCDGIAGCLRTPKGGSARQILVRAGRGRVDARLLSGRECAALMEAPGYQMNVPLNQALFAFGDAVCVNAISWIASNYLAPLLEELSLPTTAKQRKTRRPRSTVR
jgi:DNA (cytosine-5)-methyltransferase 1